MYDPTKPGVLSFLRDVSRRLVNHEHAMLISLLAGLITSLYFSDGFPSGASSTAVVLLSITAAFVAVFSAATVRYIDTPYKATPSPQDLENFEDAHSRELEDQPPPGLLKQLLRALQRSQRQLEESTNTLTALKNASSLHSVSEEELSKHREILSQQLKETTAESVLAEIRARTEEITYIGNISSIYSTTANRIESEIEALSRRGNVNLVAGLVVGVIGAGYLAYTAASVIKDISSWQSFAITFIPRIGLVALVEVFAYFFLRLYRSCLIDIRYYHNELIAIDSRQVAMMVAVKNGDHKVLSHVIRQHLTIDKNCPIDQSKTTIEIEREKMDLRPATISLDRIVETVVATLKSQQNLAQRQE